MRALTKAESKERERKLNSMTPDARAWFYERELKAREEGEATWEEFLKKEFGSGTAAPPAS